MSHRTSFMDELSPILWTNILGLLKKICIIVNPHGSARQLFLRVILVFDHSFNFYTTTFWIILSEI